MSCAHVPYALCFLLIQYLGSEQTSAYSQGESDILGESEG